MRTGFHPERSAVPVNWTQPLGSGLPFRSRNHLPPERLGGGMRGYLRKPKPRRKQLPGCVLVSPSEARDWATGGGEPSLCRLPPLTL